MNAYPQDFGYGGMPALTFGVMREREKALLKRQGQRAGRCVLGFILIQNLAALLLSFSSTLMGLYLDNPIFAQVVELLFLLLIMSPFLLAFVRMDAWEQSQVDKFQKPVSKSAAVLAVVSGFFFCTVGNFATSFLLAYLEGLGFSIGGGEYASPQTPVAFVLTCFTIGVLPALMEEFSLRGVIMQPLRSVGDSFAVGMTAFVFAMMHGNLTQIPFAFIAGIAIGYFVVATGSIWVGVAIHLLNNLSSVVLSYLLEVRPTAGETFYHIETAVSIVAGIACLALFLTVCKRNRLQKPSSVLSTGEKIRTYLCTVPMIISMLLLLWQTARLIRFMGYTNAG